MNTKRRLFALLTLILMLLILGGCAASDPHNPINAQSPGVFNHYLIYPFSLLITFVANTFDGNYGLSIVLMTLIIRLAIMPLMMNSTKKQTSMREKMALLQPEIKALEEKYKNEKSTEKQQQRQTEMMQLYQKHQVNPLNIGCLPMLLQLPITLAFYYAIQRTPEIAAHDFLWFSLGQPDKILPFIAAAVYYVQFRVSQSIAAQHQQQPGQNNPMALLGLLSPMMMGALAFAMPAALPLYWSVGGIFIIVQTIVLNKMYSKPAKQKLGTVSE
ncbi:Membrane protein insertase MisCB [Paenibacillus solanacearum]|uniref:Membrane protein insertase YidC n=1 Tax=Paenibacillus solanacearum TaxID=2048548 RepID=A0A916K8U5_9BACL|nr:membrane protein insertase YidC [Paenibacillus solanacearum]CAG7644996.1 Membrane protein insertase MisCB [Paenibacillus solanacearum]